MTLVTPNVGCLQLLNKMLQAALSTDENYLLHLFKNNYTPTDTDTASNYTEATFTNYAVMTLTRSGWQNASTVSGKAQTTYNATESWTCGASGQIVYGYYVTGATSGVLLWAEAFSTARTLANGDIINVTPSFTLASQY